MPEATSWLSAPSVPLRPGPAPNWDHIALPHAQGTSSFEGEVEGLRVEFEPAVKPIEFRRLPDKRFKDPAFLLPMAGNYAIGVREWTVRLRSDGVLTVAGRTGAPLELIGARGTRFNVKDQPGFQVEFVPDASGRYTQMALHRNGTSSVAQRQP